MVIRVVMEITIIIVIVIVPVLIIVIVTWIGTVIVIVKLLPVVIKICNISNIAECPAQRRFKIKSSEKLNQYFNQHGWKSQR